MGSVKHCANGDGKSTGAIATLPALALAVPARMTANRFAFAIWTNRTPAPTRRLKMLNRLFLRLERLEKFEDVHGFALSTKPS